MEKEKIITDKLLDKIKEKGIFSEYLPENFNLKSDKIIMQVYCYVFGAYAIFYLDRVSVLFDYLMLLLLGIFLGYRMAVRANAYSLDEASKKKQAVKKESHTR